MNVDSRFTTEKEIESYFEWLCGQISSEGLDNGYSALLDDLFSLPFVYFIPMDENRIGDAFSLRRTYGIIWDAPANVLEILVSLSERMVYIQGMDMTYWFWEMIQNLGLDEFTDDVIDFSEVHEIVDRWLHRKFRRDGTGSPFPLKYSSRIDMRRLEIWYQMQEYLNQNYDME